MAVTAKTTTASVEERVPLRGMRRKIAERMVKSRNTAAQVTHVDEIDMTEVVQLREKTKTAAEKRGIKLTYMPFIIKALIPALKQFPSLNATLDDEKEEIVLKKYYNIGIATDTEQGLVAPVVKNADHKSIKQLAEEITGRQRKSNRNPRHDISLNLLRPSRARWCDGGEVHEFNQAISRRSQDATH
jgi:pyruvate dehydrogenase E2 component (dihydrolipoamide acetyltransferase)